MATNIIPFEQDAEGHARAETDRKRKLFEWADQLLEQLGHAAKVAAANSFDDLRKIKFDAEDVQVELAIRDALHPSSGKKADYFAGIREGALKRVLKLRFDEMKKEREDRVAARSQPEAGLSGIPTGQTVSSSMTRAASVRS